MQAKYSQNRNFTLKSDFIKLRILFWNWSYISSSEIQSIKTLLSFTFYLNNYSQSLILLNVLWLWVNVICRFNKHSITHLNIDPLSQIGYLVFNKFRASWEPFLISLIWSVSYQHGFCSFSFLVGISTTHASNKISIEYFRLSSYVDLFLYSEGQWKCFEWVSTK